MGRVQGARRGPDVLAALVIGGIAMAVGGAALFGIVAHTRTPFLPGGLDAVQSLSPGESIVVSKKRADLAELARRQQLATGTEPIPDPVSPTSTPPESPLRGETVVLLPKSHPPVLSRVDEAFFAALTPIQAPRVDAKVAEPPHVAAVKLAEVKAVQPRHVETKLAQAKPLPAKMAQARFPEPRAAPAKPAPIMLAAIKPATIKPAAIKPAAIKPVAIRHVDSKPPRFRRVGLKTVEIWTSDSTDLAQPKPASSRRAEARRDTRRNEAKAAEAKLAETRHAAEMKAAQADLARTKQAVESTLEEAKAAENRLADTLAQTKAAEAKLAETQRVAQMKAIEAKLAEAKPAVDTRYVERASETRTVSPRYSCDTCGTVASVTTRSYGGTNLWEVRVNFAGGASRVFLYPSDPGLWSGDRVRYATGRLTRL